MRAPQVMACWPTPVSIPVGTLQITTEQLTIFPPDPRAKRRLTAPQSGRLALTPGVAVSRRRSKYRGHRQAKERADMFCRQSPRHSRLQKSRRSRPTRISADIHLTPETVRAQMRRRVMNGLYPSAIRRRAQWIRSKAIRTACSFQAPKNDQYDEAD